MKRVFLDKKKILEFLDMEIGVSYKNKGFMWRTPLHHLKNIIEGGRFDAKK